MKAMSKNEVQTLDDEMLLRWLTFLCRYRAEDIGLHVNTEGQWAVGDVRPSLEDIEDELVRRGLNDGPKVEPRASKGATQNESSDNRGIR
ncbi:MAG: hypothetical protein H7249_01985 [Chitinophagaceae bacterium]|nr:hypothetical protein [Oligoflexus sp.]